MKTTRFLSLLLLGLIPGVASAQNVQFQSGSSGMDGVFAPLVSTNLQLPENGRFNFSEVFIPSGVTVGFLRNSNNTPVYFLATGKIEIHGTLSVNGEAGTSLRGGYGGPGGFNGGMPGVVGSIPGDGEGPGGGRGSTNQATVGRGIYGSAIPNGPRAEDGVVYGSQLLMPLVGGSGGGGVPGIGGGGGGGAILIASSTLITNGLNAQIYAQGGTGGGWGSGGAIRMVAPMIAGRGWVSAAGPGGNANAGRIRCDLIERQFFNPTFNPATAPVTANETFMVTFPPNVPTLRLVSVAGTPVPANGPAGFTITLPFNEPAQQSIVVEATGFGAEVPIAVKLTPASGPAPAAINASILNTGTEPAHTTVIGNFPPNVPVTVNAWTR